MKTHRAVVCCFDLDPPADAGDAFQTAELRLINNDKAFVYQVSSNMFHRVVLHLEVADGQDPEVILSQTLATLELGPVKGLPYILEELVPAQV